MGPPWFSGKKDEEAHTRHTAPFDVRDVSCPQALKTSSSSPSGPCAPLKLLYFGKLPLLHFQTLLGFRRVFCYFATNVKTHLKCFFFASSKQRLLPHVLPPSECHLLLHCVSWVYENLCVFCCGFSECYRGGDEKKRPPTVLLIREETYNK